VAEKPTTLSEQKRLAILAAARDAFREKGVQGTSMDALAGRAGVSKRTVYNHFPSKETLVLQLLAEYRETARQRLHVKYNAGKPLEPQLLTLIGSEIELACDPDYLELARLAAGHFFYRPEALRQRAGELNLTDTSLHRWLEEAASDGQLSLDDPGFVADLLRHLVQGACLWPQLMGLAPVPSGDQQRRIADEAVAMVLARFRVG
jgi:TetR/AcrR family transcriptional regulator of autoinduction and epiphytic fitness